VGSDGSVVVVVGIVALVVVVVGAVVVVVGGAAVVGAVVVVVGGAAVVVGDVVGGAVLGDPDMAPSVERSEGPPVHPDTSTATAASIASPCRDDEAKRYSSGGLAVRGQPAPRI
jgi:hypothetical protein